MATQAKQRDPAHSARGGPTFQQEIETFFFSCESPGLSRSERRGLLACPSLDVSKCSLGFQVINFDSPRGGISLVTEKGPVTSSRLLIQKAGPSDDGDYTCDPASANPATVRVHILNGKQHSASCRAIALVSPWVYSLQSSF